MWQNTTILVAGMGQSGLSMLAYLHQQGAKVAAYDAAWCSGRQSQLQAQYPDLTCFSGNLADALAYGFDVLAVSPGISCRLPEIVAFEQQGGQVIGDVEILARILNQRGDKIIAVTGSNGKTTVTSLVGHLCRENGWDTVVAGNIGLPVLTAELERNGRAADVWVLELSSFQLETAPSLNATAAVCLNVSEDHLERYRDMLDYAHTKAAIFAGSGVQVLNADDAFCRAMKRAGRPVKWFSLQQPSDYWLDKGYLKANDESLLAAEEIALQGRHNQANVLAAWALCEAIGLPREGLCAAVKTFRGLPHRVEKVGEKNGIVFIDDSKGTNVGATLAAIEGLDAPLLLILGGQAKGQDFTPLRPVLQNKAKALFLIGIDAPAIEADLRDGGVPFHHCRDMDEAVRQAYAAAGAGDIVLLSPACASLDMFTGYAHRAAAFIAAFQALSD